ncbi:MAG: hypothetical protein KAJ10_00220, partial [Thermodesulfovibrionia bacterium]|nr:hypothetical protein [Thermodesulfovibrionia bacterium]
QLYQTTKVSHNPGINKEARKIAFINIDFVDFRIIFMFSRDIKTGDLLIECARPKYFVRKDLRWKDSKMLINLPD